MKRKVTIEDVAKYCNVSKSSVSRYLNQGYVSAENKNKIKQAIEELGFERDFFASRLRAKRSRLIGIIANDISKLEHAKTLQGIQRKLNKLGYQGMILLADGKEKKEKECLQSFIQQGVDGVIFVDCKHPNHVKEMIEENQMKVVFAQHACTFASFLDIDEKKAGKLLGEHFMEQNIRHVIYLGKDKDIAQKRKDGFLDVYKDRNFDCNFEILKIKDKEDAYKQAKELIHAEAIICEKEAYGLSVLKYFQEVHIHVPQNISIACFGSGDLTSHCVPSLTVVSCDYEAFGNNLVELIISILENKQPNWQKVSQTLLERESVRSY